MEKRLQLALLGGLRITQSGAPIADLSSLKGQALLCYLAVTGRPHSRAALAGLLWPEQPEADARANLRTVLAKLHKVVAPHLAVTREAVAFDPARPYWLDVERFLDALRRAPALPAPAAPAVLREAADLYRGDFLQGFYIRDAAPFEEWVVGEREYLRGLAVDALHRLAAAYTRQGNYAAAIDCLNRLLALEPWREEAHRQLMQLLALTGQRSAALNQYALMRRQLQAELGIAPEVESQALAEQIRKNELKIENEELRMSANTISQFSIYTSQFQDEAPDLGSFYGRAAELATLQRWLLADSCRVVALVGMGGVGKTALAARLAEAVASQFERVIWRSLRNAPPLDEIVRGWLQILSAQQLGSLPNSPGERLTLLLGYLHRSRCLLILDNLESILQHEERAGVYRAGFEDYGQLIQRLGQSRHQSCLVLTSREQPLELARLERESPLVHSLQLAGLSDEAGQAILQEQGLAGEAASQAALLERYSSNPLALKLVAATIHDLFAGDLAAFLRDETPIFDDIRDVLDQQFARLSALERELLLWLASEREPTTVSTLQANLLRREPQRALLEALRSLQRRSLLERSGEGFTLQNVVMEYATDLLVSQVVRELATGELDLFARHALAKAQAREYVRQSQLRLILAPVAERLAARLGRAQLLAKLRALPDALRARAELAASYAAGNVLNLLIHLGADLRGLDLARLAVWQADLRGIAGGAVSFAHSDLAGSRFTDAFQAASSVAFSPDGQLLAAGTGSGAVRLWRFADGQPAALYEGHTAKVWSVAFSCDGRRLASASEDQTVRLWDVDSGLNYATLAGHAGWVRSVAFSPNGMLLASASDDQTLRLWDGHSGQALRVLGGHTSRVRAVAFSPDGALLASAGADQTVRLWDSASGECLRVLGGHTSRVRAVAFSPTGSLLASASYDRMVRLWDVVSGQTVHILQGHTDWVQALAFSPDGALLASAGADQTVRLWDSASGRTLRILQGHQHSIEALAFHPSGTVLASDSVDQTVRLWDSATGQIVQLLYGYTQRMRAIAVSPDGAAMASTGADQLVWLWDAHSRQPRTVVQANIGLVEALAFSPDGALLASAGERAVRLTDARTGNTVRILHGHSDTVYAVAFNHNGTLLASGSRDQSVRLWDMQTGTALQILGGHRDWVKTVAFSPDGALLASGSDDQSIRVWDTAGHRACLVLHGHTKSVSSVAFSPDGALLASASADQTVVLWDVARGARRTIFSDHRNSVTSIAFSPDGTLLASAGVDQIAHLWDLRQQRLRRTLRGHTGGIRSIAFSPDGALLVSGSDDETVRLWDVSTGCCVDILRTPGPYAGMNIASATGLTEAQRSALRALGAVER